MLTCVECKAPVIDFPYKRTKHLYEIVINYKVLVYKCSSCGAIYFPGKVVKATDVHTAITIVDNMITEGKYLKYMRKAIGYTRDDLAKLIYIEGVDNVTTRDIEEWEKGDKPIPSSCLSVLHIHVYREYLDKDLFDLFLAVPEVVSLPKPEG